MQLNKLDNEKLFEYLKVYNKFKVCDKQKINFIVYKNHLMYLKENNIKKYNYYYDFLEETLTSKKHLLKSNIKINSIDDLLYTFNNCMKKRNNFFENSLLLNDILTNNGLCPFVLYAFNDLVFKCPISLKKLKDIIEFSIMYLYRIVEDKKTLSNLKLFNESGAVSNIYLDSEQVIKYPKTVASRLFLMQQEIDAYNYLSKTKLKKFLPKEYAYDRKKNIIMHNFVNGENGEFYLFNHIPFTKDQIISLKEFYDLYLNLQKKIILDIHPGNFIWNEEIKSWVLIDLGILPTIGSSYYIYDNFDGYFENIWIKREETMKKIPIRSLDFGLDLDVKDKVLKYE